MASMNYFLIIKNGDIQFMCAGRVSGIIFIRYA